MLRVGGRRRIEDLTRFVAVVCTRETRAVQSDRVGGVDFYFRLCLGKLKLLPGFLSLIRARAVSIGTDMYGKDGTVLRRLVCPNHGTGHVAVQIAFTIRAERVVNPEQGAVIPAFVLHLSVCSS